MSIFKKRSTNAVLIRSFWGRIPEIANRFWSNISPYQEISIKLARELANTKRVKKI